MIWLGRAAGLVAIAALAWLFWLAMWSIRGMGGGG